MKVLISGYYGFRNAGDEAILSSMIKGIREYNPEIQIIVLSNDPEETKRIHDVDAVNRWRFREIWKALKEVDGFISGGGSLLQDHTGWRSIPYYSGIILLARLLRKPVIIFSQGIGPIRKRFNMWLTKITLNAANFVSVRDEDSRIYLKKNLGMRKKIELVPDPVIGMGRDILRRNEEYNFEDSIRKIVVSIRKWPSHQDYLGKIARGLDECAKLGHQIIFVPMHGSDDEDASNQVAKLMTTESKVISHTVNYKDKMDIIGRGDVVFAMRLHALTFAAVHRVPFVALSYDPKIISFANLYHQPLLGSVDGNWSGEDLFHLIAKQIKHRQEMANRLDEIIDPLTKEVILSYEKVLVELKKK